MGNETQRPNYPQLLEIPGNLTPAQLAFLVNDRIKDLNELFKRIACNPAVVDLDMANFRIVDLADPTDDLDAVNLRTLRRQGGQAVSSVAASSSGGKDAYTIVYNIPGFLGPDESIPAFVVGKDRTGTPAEAWVYALGPPSIAAFQLQLTRQGSNILSAPLVLGLGANGPVFSTTIAGGQAFQHGDVVKLVPIDGSASGISVGLVVERT